MEGSVMMLMFYGVVGGASLEPVQSVAEKLPEVVAIVKLAKIALKVFREEYYTSRKKIIPAPITRCLAFLDLYRYIYIVFSPHALQ